MMTRFVNRALPILARLWAAAMLLAPVAARGQGSFVNWETPTVHPIDLSPDGQTLAVANLPACRVDFYDLATGVPISTGSVQVGVDPVTARFRTNEELWVVNFISDTVNVIDVPARRIIATISVPPDDLSHDEPQDVVFAGNPQRAFISCSQVNKIQVYDPFDFSRKGTVDVLGEDPRALAVSPDGSKVYAAIFESGNGTTILGGGGDDSMEVFGFPPDAVGDPVGPYGGANPPPNVGGVNGTFSPPKNPANGTPPRVGLIVRKNAAGEWRDDNNQDWTSMVTGANAGHSGRPIGWDLPDRDLAIIDANTLATTYARRLMNICMAVGVNPANGNAYVVGTEAFNEIRFEPNVKGKFVHVVTAIVDPAAPAAPTIVDLNPHLNYSTANVPQSIRDLSVGDPRAIEWDSAGQRGYVAGMGSNNLIVINASGARIAGTAQAPTEVGEGPAGIAIDEARGRLYVLNRFEGSISVVDSASLGELARVSYHDPTPAAIKTGRKHLYDTRKNSGLGQVACGSCHLDAKMDRLAWDLGDPSGDLDPVAGQNKALGIVGASLDANFHPMKGPMTTQTLQDIIGKEPLHWRGDRDGLENFAGAFVGLQGDDAEISPPEMQEFESFLATIHFPPNPFRTMENALPESLDTGQFKSGRFGGAGQPLPIGNAIAGLQKFRKGVGPNNTALDDGTLDCVTCHTLPTGAGPDRQLVISGSLDLSFPVFPGSPGPMGEKHLGLVGDDGSTQDAIKIPQLRNQFDKTGFETTPGHQENLAGFGVVHDGSVDSLARFVSEPIFRVGNDQDVADLVAFLMAFSGSDLPLGKTTGTVFPRDAEPLGELSKDTHAAVGEQLSLIPLVGSSALDQILGEANEDGSALARGIDVVAKMRLDGVERGWFYNRFTGNFISDKDSDGEITLFDLRLLASGGETQTFTAVPRGSGLRLGIDRDLDGFGDRTEIEACSDPDDGSRTPLSPQPEIATSPALPGGSVDFGPANVGAPTSPQTVTVANDGPGALKFTGAKLAIIGADAADFRISNSPSTAPIGASQNLDVGIVFDPRSEGTKSASLLIVTNDCDEPVLQVPLAGIASEIPLTPTPSPSPTPVPPTFVLHPLGQKVNIGQDVQLSAAAVGGAGIAYSWLKGGDPVPNADSGLLLIAGAQPADAGSYQCQASNGGGTALSFAASLTVFNPAEPNAAVYLESSAPATMAPSQDLFVGVVMRNSSALTWAAAQGYSLAVIEDAAGLFEGVARLALADPGLVVPATVGAHSFVGFIRAPASEGTVTARLRMVQEGVEFFGDVVELTIVVEQPPNRAEDWTLYD